MNKTVITLLTAVLVATPLAFAEGKHKQGGEHRGKHRAAHMQEQFGVSDDQLAQMREIRENGGSRDEARAVLSDNQRSQIDQWRKDNPRGGKGSHHQRSSEEGE